MALKVKRLLDVQLDDIHPSWRENAPELIERLEALHGEELSVDPILGFPWLLVVGLLVVNAISFGVGFVLGGLQW